MKRQAEKLLVRDAILTSKSREILPFSDPFSGDGRPPFRWKNAGANSARSGGGEGDLHRSDHLIFEGCLTRLDQGRFHPLELGGPGLIGGKNREHATLECDRPAVAGDVGADHRFPVSEQRCHRTGRRKTQRTDDAVQPRPDPAGGTVRTVRKRKNGH